MAVIYESIAAIDNPAVPISPETIGFILCPVIPMSINNTKGIRGISNV